LLAPPISTRIRRNSIPLSNGCQPVSSGSDVGDGTTSTVGMAEGDVGDDVVRSHAREASSNKQQDARGKEKRRVTRET
jgi:hypothetical protein